MVSYKKINAFDIEEEGVVLVEANLQGVINYPGFEKSYPKAYDLYMKTCAFNYRGRAGTFLLVEEKGRKVAIIFTSYSRKEKADKVIEAFKRGLANLLHAIPSDVFIYLPVLGRRSYMFSQFSATIKSVDALTKDAPRQWVICTKGER